MTKYLLIFITLLTPNITLAGNIKCLASHSLIHHDARIDASYFFHLKNSSGLLKLDGIFKTGNEPEHISREVNFSYTQTNNVYTITNTKLIKFPLENVDAKKMAEHYPDFFLKEGATITLQFIPFDKHGYNVTFNHSLLFYCNKL
jgi:hypothetical protein